MCSLSLISISHVHTENELSHSVELCIKTVKYQVTEAKWKWMTDRKYIRPIHYNRTTRDSALSFIQILFDLIYLLTRIRKSAKYFFEYLWYSICYNHYCFVALCSSFCNVYLTTNRYKQWRVNKQMKVTNLFDFIRHIVADNYEDSKFNKA